MASGTNISERIANIMESKAKISARLVDLGVALETDNLATIATKIEENITNQGAVSATVVEGQTYTIPKGYHNGSGTVTGLTDTTGEAEKYKLQSKEITPTKNEINVTPDSGYYGLSDVTVNPIPSAYQDVSSVTTGASDVLSGKVFVAKDGTVTTGTMPNNGAVSQTLTPINTAYSVPKGYHNGAGIIGISIEEKTATPTKETQNVTPSVGKVISKVTINPIPQQFVDVSTTTAKPENILVGTFAGINAGTENEPDYKVIEGTMPSNTRQSVILNFLASGSNTYQIPKGYHTGEGSVSITPQDKTVTPTKLSQTVKADSNFVLKTVTVNPIPNEYITTNDATATAENILDGETAYIKGVKVEGTMVNNGAFKGTMTGLTASSSVFEIPTGYHNGSTISLTSDIEDLLAQI